MTQLKKSHSGTRIRRALNNLKLHRTLFSITAIPVIAMLAPSQAASANSSIHALSGQTLSNSPTLIFNDYLNFAPKNNAQALGSLLSESLARDIMIGAMLAICIAMIAGASFLFRENVNHIRSEAEARKRESLCDF